MSDPVCVCSWDCTHEWCGCDVHLCEHNSTRQKFGGAVVCNYCHRIVRYSR